MKKILYVDDDKKIALAVRMRLESVGYDVSVAHDAQTALNLAANGSPDVVLLDIHLPGRDGFSVASRMQGIAQTAGTPIIFVTASRQAGIKQRAAKLGAIAFLEKPFASANLIEAIEKSSYSTRFFGARMHLSKHP